MTVPFDDPQTKQTFRAIGLMILGVLLVGIAFGTLFVAAATGPYAGIVVMVAVAVLIAGIFTACAGVKRLMP